MKSEGFPSDRRDRSAEHEALFLRTQSFLFDRIRGDFENIFQKRGAIVLSEGPRAAAVWKDGSEIVLELPGEPQWVNPAIAVFRLIVSSSTVARLSLIVLNPAEEDSGDIVIRRDENIERTAEEWDHDLRTLESEALTGAPRRYRYLVSPPGVDLEDYLMRFQEHIRSTLSEALDDIATVRDIPDTW